jgi:hypothetical protein
MHWMSVKLLDNFQIREHSWRAGFILWIKSVTFSSSTLVMQLQMVDFSDLMKISPLAH